MLFPYHEATKSTTRPPAATKSVTLIHVIKFCQKNKLLPVSVTKHTKFFDHDFVNFVAFVPS